MRVWIRDQDSTPQRFPLQRLLRRAIAVVGRGVQCCHVIRASGYGLRVHELEEQLDSVEFVNLTVAELDDLCLGVEEWFYDLEVEIPEGGVRLGLHDSTALFVEGERVLVEAIAAAF